MTGIYRPSWAPQQYIRRRRTIPSGDPAVTVTAERAEAATLATTPTADVAVEPVAIRADAGARGHIARFEGPAALPWPQSRLAMRIEAAFGAGDTSPLGWTWTDVSDRNRLQAQEISIRRGRADESAQPQPSEFQFVLDNGDGALMPDSALSPWYPNVRRGLPLRVMADGAENALLIPGINGSYASTPDHPSLALTGEIDIRARLLPDQWSTGIKWVNGVATATEPQYIVTKSATPSDISWLFAIWDPGWPAFQWSTDGTSGGSESGLRASEVASSSPIWLAQAFTPDNGSGAASISFYRHDDKVPPDSLDDWTLIGTATGSDVGPAFTGSAPIEVGSRGGGLASYRGRIFRVEIRDGINGTLVACPDFSAQRAGDEVFQDGLGRTWTVNGRAEITTLATRIVGEVGSIEPSWPYGDNHPSAASPYPTEARVNISASGILRRLTQGAKPLRSSLYRHINGARRGPTVAAYWPMEDAAEAVRLASGKEGHPAAVITSGVAAASDDTLPASASLPSMQNGEAVDWSSVVEPGLGLDDAWTLDMFVRLPTPETAPTETRIIQIDTGGTVAQWRVSISDTTFRLVAVDTSATEVLNTAVGISSTTFGPWQLLRLQVTTDGADLDWSWLLINIDTGAGGGTSGTIAATTVGAPTKIGSVTTGPADGLSFGHVTLHDGTNTSGWLAGADTAWVGETAAHRFWRLCQEEGVPAEILGAPDNWFHGRGDPTKSEPMGPQRRRTFVELLGECAEVDLGVVSSRLRSPGLVYRSRRTLEHQVAALALDAANNEIVEPLAPVLDDQRLRNSVSVSSVFGSASIATDPDSIAAEGLYETEVEIPGVGGVNVQSAIILAVPGLDDAIDDQNHHQATWRLLVGTWPGLRYPVVATDLAIAPHLIKQWHEVALGDRITVRNLPTQAPSEVVDLIVEAIDETLSPIGWVPVLTCSPGGPWMVGELAEDSGSILLLPRLTATATLSVAASATDTTLTLDSAGWTETTTDFPLLVTLGGETVQVGGASSGDPQSLTSVVRSVNGVVKAHPVGTVVQVAQPFRLALGGR